MTKITCRDSGIEFESKSELDKTSYLLGYADGAESVSKWISVKDRLPPLMESVLVSQFKSKIDNDIYVAWIEKLGIKNKPMWQYSWCCGCYVPKGVTHWMPLPEPPQA
jgi:hypothetical protein